MSFPRVVIEPIAERDIDAALAWYYERGAALGDGFFAEVDAALERLREHPLLYRDLEAGLRRAPLDRFPYGIFYFIRDEAIYVIGVLHDSRDPQVWRRRAR